MRRFGSGATRDTEKGKPDYEGFLSPVVLKRFADYMHRHRYDPAGGYRDSDNWQKGMPPTVYLSSLIRHVMDLWLHHRSRGDLARGDIQEALCAIMFNAQGYLYELLRLEPVDVDCTAADPCDSCRDLVGMPLRGAMDAQPGLQRDVPTPEIVDQIIGFAGLKAYVAGEEEE